MSRITKTEVLSVSFDCAQVREHVLAWFAAIPHTVVTDTPNRLEVKSGSQAKMRLLGGWFIAGSSLPTRTEVAMKPTHASTEVIVTAAEAAGIGFMWGMEGKYAQRAAEIVTGIRSALT
jgi:hypothetical protein